MYGAQELPGNCWYVEYGERPSVQENVENQVAAEIMFGLSSVITTDLLHQPGISGNTAGQLCHWRCKFLLHIALLDIEFGGSRGEVDASSYLA